MERCKISELISRLKEIIEKYNAGCYNETCNPFESCTDCVLKQIREVIESQPPADQWIPCSERLPDESMDTNNDGIVTVLVTWAFKDMWFNGCSYCDVVDYDLVFKCFIFSEGKKVTAWKPVEPYKGVE